MTVSRSSDLPVGGLGIEVLPDVLQVDLTGTQPPLELGVAGGADPAEPGREPAHQLGPWPSSTARCIMTCSSAVGMISSRPPVGWSGSAKAWVAPWS